ncbi:CatB-related O-acetyltransferase [Enterovirga rhinocerotis]|uniref:CatB-related O-acetyltransferase n=1 Tax=Enterovirga rhinocerotis TaxID=1339210 RepID=UPI00105ED147
MQRLRRGRNPHNQTAIHLAPLIRRWGHVIGDYSYGHPKVRFSETGAKLRMGRYCSIADKVEILLGGNHRLDWTTTYPFTALPELWPTARDLEGSHASKGDVTIGNDVWIGSACMILSGVTIGHGAVIGARAVVAKDVPPYAIVAGNPARVIRIRFPQEVVEALLDGAWWDLPRAQVEPLIPLLQSNRIPELLAALGRIRGG